MKTYGDLRPGDVLCWHVKSDYHHFSNVYMIIGVEEFPVLSFDCNGMHENPVVTHKYTLLLMYDRCGSGSTSRLTCEVWRDATSLHAQNLTVIR